MLHIKNIALSILFATSAIATNATNIVADLQAASLANAFLNSNITALTTPNINIIEVFLFVLSSASLNICAGNFRQHEPTCGYHECHHYRC